MNSETHKTTVSFPIVGLLGISFVVLKLCGVIAWPWIWVTAPFWAAPALLLTIAAVFSMCALICAIIESCKDGN
ncbi:hypothetical protein EBZ39_02820 [bacterium]|nr:hypothetical protein [bacterium]